MSLICGLGRGGKHPGNVAAVIVHFTGGEPATAEPDEDRDEPDNSFDDSPTIERLHDGIIHSTRQNVG